MDDSEYEQERLLALHRYGLLDSPPEAIFDGITVAIANICEVPIALVSLVDANRQWFKSVYGLKIKETHRELAFCDHAIKEPDELMLVEDAAEDERFRSNPLVTADPRIRFYAGKPIVSADGYPVGTLCVIDRSPRKLRPYQLDALNALSGTVSAILDERYRIQKVVADREHMENVLNRNLGKYQHLYEDAEMVLRGFLQQFPTASLVISQVGTVVSFNDAWTQFSSAAGFSSIANGGNYFDACGHATSPFGSDRDAALAGMRSVVSGDIENYHLEYSSAIGNCRMEVQPVSGSASAVLVQHFHSAIN